MNLSEVQSNAAKSPWMATVLVDKNPVDFKLDSGADVTVVSLTIPSLTLIFRRSYSLLIKYFWVLAITR